MDKSKTSEPAKKKVMELEQSEISELITECGSKEKAGYDEADNEPLLHQKRGPSHSMYVGYASVQVQHSHSSPSASEDDDDDGKSGPH